MANSILEPGEIDTGEVTVNLSASALELKENILWLVAEIVRLEKLRKHKAYEDFINGEDPRKWRRKLRPAELNPEGKSPVTFLQEYCYHVLKKAPSYETFIQDDPRSPFVTRVLVGGKELSKASWVNKKLSKQVAALNALDKLSPGLYPHSYFQPQLQQQKNIEQERALANKDLLITDERLLIADGNEKTPAQVLQEYCNREDVALHMDASENVNTDNPQRFLIRLNVQNWHAEAQGKSKKEAKQRAAQQLLKQMYPHLRTWGELLQHCEEDKELQMGKGPNMLLLKKLKAEMLKRYPLHPKEEEDEDEGEEDLEGDEDTDYDMPLLARKMFTAPDYYESATLSWLQPEKTQSPQKRKYSLVDSFPDSTLNIEQSKEKKIKV